jgi:membrane protease YdiL (CAAX protease family)
MTIETEAAGKGSFERRENRRSITYAIACIGWALLLNLSSYLLEDELLSDAWTWPLALLPILTALLVYYLYYRFYINTDELGRKIQNVGLIGGFAVGVLYLICLMSLKNIGIASPGVNNIFVVFVVAYSLTSGYMVWKYKQ